MAMRLTRVSEENPLLALQNGLWGARRDLFRAWQVGDEIAFIVGKS